jgi:hypothetical protein
MTRLRHPASPCGECPWRLDQPAGRFPPERYEALANTCGSRATGSAPLDAPLFACHKTPEGRETACAGWLAVEGADHVGVRLAVVTGRLDAAALEPGDDWPALYPTFADMAHANGATTEEH